MTEDTASALPGLDLAALRGYLDTARPGLFTGELSGRLIAGGRSNLTYVVTDGQRELVLRRPPLSHVLATAHDMSREFRVLSALEASPVPVPHTELLCTEAEVLGAPFYLMQRVDGVAMRSLEDAAWMSDEQARAVSLRLVEVLAELHAIDPDRVGLGEFGKPDGYLRRQLDRFGKQLESSRSRELPGIEELASWLRANIPESRRAAIVHGDYRLDNALVRADPLEITAVLDWEMATLGDPLADLGLLYVYWTGTGESDSSADPITGGLTKRSGFPTFAELAEHYARYSGTDIGELHWYVALGCYKLAVILEGIHYRFSTGGTVGAGFEQMGNIVLRLIENGLAARTGEH
ncbi:phosphotransferase family protein [Sciscionella sediminilitoris]|uniref:phosphotransferase family protein n=1 Tax=Sciscionella sediminilitoris TaxID=1445613 RepID=UPI0004DF1F6B|nr:phosphotransferase family protein [Sciscionella sp. SE31]